MGEDGEKHRPIMIHRALLGSIERFIGVITEHFAGAFPTWLHPVQVKLLPVTDRAADYAKEIASKLSAQGFRVEVDGKRSGICISSWMVPHCQVRPRLSERWKSSLGP